MPRRGSGTGLQVVLPVQHCVNLLRLCTVSKPETLPVTFALQLKVENPGPENSYNCHSSCITRCMVKWIIYLDSTEKFYLSCSLRHSSWRADEWNFPALKSSIFDGFSEFFRALAIIWRKWCIWELRMAYLQNWRRLIKRNLMCLLDNRHVISKHCTIFHAPSASLV